MIFHVGRDLHRYGTVELHDDGRVTLTPRPGFADELGRFWGRLAETGDPLAWMQDHSSPGRGYPNGAWAEPVSPPPGRQAPPQSGA